MRDKIADQRGFLTLIELLVVLVIIFGMYYVFMGGYGGGSRTAPGITPGQPTRPGGPTSLPGQAIERARSVQCESNLRQVRQAIDIYKMNSEGRSPGSLDDLKISSVTSCPVTHTPYSYDPSTGRAWCTTPGHERY